MSIRDHSIIENGQQYSYAPIGMISVLQVVATSTNDDCTTDGATQQCYNDVVTMCFQKGSHLQLSTFSMDMYRPSVEAVN